MYILGKPKAVLDGCMHLIFNLSIMLILMPRSTNKIKTGIYEVYTTYQHHSTSIYSNSHRQHQNEMCLNAFGGKTQTHLHSPCPSNGGNS